MDLLPYDLIELIGEQHGWDVIIASSVVCRDWYNYLSNFPWDRVMPFHKRFSDAHDYKPMSLFTMLYQIQNILKYRGYPKHRETLCLVNRIPIIDTGYRNRTDFSYETPKVDYDPNSERPSDAIIRKRLQDAWQLDQIRNRRSLATKCVTMPASIRHILLTDDYLLEQNVWNHWGNTQVMFYHFDDDHLDDNFVQTHMVLPYSGITDYYQQINKVSGGCEKIYLLSDETMYILDMINHVELARITLNFPGIKFIGFVGNQVFPMSLQANGVLHVMHHDWVALDPNLLKLDRAFDKKGYYIIYDNHRLNCNKLNIDEYCVSGITKSDPYEESQKSTNGYTYDSTTDEILADKRGPNPTHTLSETLGYSANFWSFKKPGEFIPAGYAPDSAFDETPLPSYINQTDLRAILYDRRHKLRGDSDHNPIYDNSIDQIEYNNEGNRLCYSSGEDEEDLLHMSLDALNFDLILDQDETPSGVPGIY